MNSLFQARRSPGLILFSAARTLSSFSPLRASMTRSLLKRDVKVRRFRDKAILHVVAVEAGGCMPAGITRHPRFVEISGATIEALALAVPKIDSDFGCAADAPPLEIPGAVVQLEPEAAASEPPSVLFGLDSVRPAVELAGHEDAAYQHGAQPKALRGRREERGGKAGGALRALSPIRRSTVIAT